MDIRYFRGSDNVVADVITRPYMNALVSSFHLTRLAEFYQAGLCLSDSCSLLDLGNPPSPCFSSTILCHLSTEVDRPLVPTNKCRTVINVFIQLLILVFEICVNSFLLVLFGCIWILTLSYQPRGVWIAKEWRFTVTDFLHHACMLFLKYVSHTYWPCETVTAILWEYWRPNRRLSFCPLAHSRAYSGYIDRKLQQWICFCVPTTITTNRASQFQSTMICQFPKPLAFSQIMVTAYHPLANGLVEQFHPQPKVTLMSNKNPASWSANLPLVLLSFRSSVKDVMQCFTAKTVFDAPIQLPSEYFYRSFLATHDISQCVE